jgi:uncharacterized tellurite resistance protein B-like protein
MAISFVDLDNKDFDPALYIQVLVAVAKADKDNGPREFEYVKKQAGRLGIDFKKVWNSTDRTFVINNRSLSRFTALLIIRDCILLASMDENFSLAERKNVYIYAEKLDITRSDVDSIIEWLNDSKRLENRWNKLVSGENG